MVLRIRPTPRRSSANNAYALVASTSLHYIAREGGGLVSVP